LIAMLALQLCSWLAPVMIDDMELYFRMSELRYINA
jgi:hypothetical protein